MSDEEIKSHDLLTKEIRGVTWKVILVVLVPFFSTSIFVVNGYVHLMIEINSFKKDATVTTNSLIDIKNSIVEIKKDNRTTNERIDRQDDRINSYLTIKLNK